MSISLTKDFTLFKLFQITEEGVIVAVLALTITFAAQTDEVILFFNLLKFCFRENKMLRILSRFFLLKENNFCITYLLVFLHTTITKEILTSHFFAHY